MRVMLSGLVLKAGSWTTRGYRYKTDDQGRIKEVHADELKFTERAERVPHNQKTPAKQKGDHAGHLIGDQFGGSPEIDNNEKIAY